MDEFLNWLQSGEVKFFLECSAADVLFECAKCGQCCQGEKYIAVEDQDIERIAIGKGITQEEAQHTYTDDDPQNRSGVRMLKNIEPNNQCIFYDACRKICSIYEYRPTTCRAHPIMNLSPDYGLVFNRNCPGAMHLEDTLHKSKDDTSIKRKMERLKKKRQDLTKLQIKLYIHGQQRIGRDENANETAQRCNIELPFDEIAFKRSCLAYLLLSINLS